MRRNKNKIDIKIPVPTEEEMEALRKEVTFEVTYLTNSPKKEGPQTFYARSSDESSAALRVIQLLKNAWPNITILKSELVSSQFCNVRVNRE